MSEAIWSSAILFADGSGESAQLHMIQVGPDKDHLIDTGIIEKVVFGSSTPKGEAEDPRQRGPSNLSGEVEQVFIFAGQHFPSIQEAFAAYETAGRPAWTPPNDPLWKLAL